MKQKPLEMQQRTAYDTAVDNAKEVQDAFDEAEIAVDETEDAFNRRLSLC